MSAKAFTAYEALRIGREMEMDGLVFYEALAEAVANQEIKALARRLADAEREHVRRFAEMIASEKYEDAWSADDLQAVEYYIREKIDRDVFPGKEAAAEISTYITNLYDALTLAIRLERRTVAYYEKLHAACAYSAGREAFGQLVEEERRHAAELEKSRGEID